MRVYVGDSYMPSKLIRINDNNVELRIDENVNEFVTRKVKKAFEARAFENMRIRIPRNKPHLSNLGCLKIAHLEAFRYFGYSYLLTDNGAFIVDKIKTQNLHIPAHDVVLLNPLPAPDGLYYAGIDAFRSFLVVFTLKTPEVVRVGVLIPGHGKEALDEYLKFQLQSGSAHTVEFSLEKTYALPLSPPPANRYEWLWKECQKREVSSH